MRVLTRSDFDGLACCVLLKMMGVMDEVKFIHPKDMQDGRVEVTSNDILANVPYVEGCGMWFDHHSSEQERIERYAAQDGLFRSMIESHTKTEGNCIITDLRGVEEIFTGNRFVVYALYPDQNISIWVVDGKQKQNAVFAVGASIINKSSKTDVGSRMLQYGGGGHKKVGTCQVPCGEANRVLKELTQRITEDG